MKNRSVDGKVKKLVCVGVLWSIIFHVLVDTSKSTEYSNRFYFFWIKWIFYHRDMSGPPQIIMCPYCRFALVKSSIKIFKWLRMASWLTIRNV